MTDGAAGGPGRRLSAAGAAAVFGALTVLFTWPQAVRLTSVPDFKDAYFNIWRMAWVAHQLPSDPLQLFDANIFHPLTNTLAFSDAVLLQGVLGAPLAWLGLPSVVVYNLAVLASFVMCGLGMFLLVRSLTGNSAAGILGGIVFAYAPFRFDHYYHLELLWAQWMPLSLWMLHRTLKSGRLAHGLTTGVLVALQGYSCIYYVVFFATTLAFMVPVLLLGAREAATRRSVAALAAGAALAAVLLAPYLLPYAAARSVVGERPASDLVVWSAGPKHYLAATPDSILYGSLSAERGSPEKRQFVGLAVMCLVIAASWPPFNPTGLAYVVALAVALDGSFGHRGIVFSWLREHVFVFRGLRVPARYGHVVLLASGVLAALGLARVQAATACCRPAVRRLLPLVIIMTGAAEYLTWPRVLIPLETTAGPAYRWLAAQPAGVVAEFPFPASAADVPREGLALYRSTFHWKPLLNGYSGYYPSSYYDLWEPLASFPSDGSIGVLRARGVSYVLVHERDYGTERYAAVVNALNQRLDIEAFGPFGEVGRRITVWRFRSSVHSHRAAGILPSEAKP